VEAAGEEEDDDEGEGIRDSGKDGGADADAISTNRRCATRLKRGLSPSAYPL